LFTLRPQPDAVAAEAAASFSVELCRFLAQATEGIYQVDGLGFFDTTGRLLIKEA
jgi:hypothetical protein